MNLERKAKALAQKFYDDCQELFDSPEMTDALYDGDTFQALQNAQNEASEVLDEAS